ncbi:MAG: hypothetical protein EXR71_06200 [Myxococcales bacterium]|nr:hypothetical protein [Myxococcales bacterium]
MRTFALMSLLVVLGCVKEKPPVKSGGGVVAQDGGITSETELPDDKDTRKFADYLVRNPMSEFSPSDGGGATIRWKSVAFGPKNHWHAEALITAAGESVECAEGGRWTMDKAESPEKATVNLETKNSTCPGRSDSVSYRLVMSRSDNGWQIVFR